jgi:MFS superfamily sulfate permease-like transporter
VQTRVLGRLAARPDFIAAVAALLGVLVFDTLPGLFIGIGMSILLLLYRVSRPHVAVLGRVPGAPGAVGRRRAPPRERAPAGCRRPAARSRALLRQRGPDPA